MDGWIKLYRKIEENPLYLAETFTRIQAWIDLLLLANSKEGFFFIRGNKVIVNRGQVGASSRTLANRWKWSRGKVERFLKDLKNSNQIEPQKNGVTTLISICNYEEYQNTEPQTGPQTSHRRATDEPQTSLNKKEKKEKNNNNIIIQKKILFAEFVFLKQEEYNKLCFEYSEKATKRMIEILNNYKGSSGKKYKSDYMAILNWVVSRYKEELQKNGNERTKNNQGANDGNDQKISGATKQPDLGTGKGRSDESQKNYSERF